jgi:hypothetical protein
LRNESGDAQFEKGLRNLELRVVRSGASAGTNARGMAVAESLRARRRDNNEEDPMNGKTSAPVCSRSVAIVWACALALGSCGEPPSPDGLTSRSSGLTTFALYQASALAFIPAGISDSGVVVGTAFSGTPAAVPVSLYNGVETILQLPAGLGSFFQVDAISKSGVTVGTTADNTTAVIWNVSPTCLTGNCPPAVTFVGPPRSTLTPTGVNNFNEVVGNFFIAGPQGRTGAFRWTGAGGFEELTPPTGDVSVTANGINDSGLIVGKGERADTGIEGLRWSASVPPVVTSLGLGAELTRIRDNGDAVGMSNLDTTTNLWTLAGQTLPLDGPQASHIDGFTDDGRVVGFTFGSHAPWTAFQGATTFLPFTSTPTFSAIAQLAVNTCGTIVGTQFNTDGTSSGLMWSKVGCDQTSPPTFTLTVAVTNSNGGTGRVSVTPPGTSCSLPVGCPFQFPQGTVVALKANPDGPKANKPASVFAGWKGACAGNKTATCQLTMNSTTSTTAVFALKGSAD